MTNQLDVLNAREAAALVGAHVETIRRLARQGVLPSFKVGRDWRFHRTDILAWAHGGDPARSQIPSVLIIDDEPSVRQVLERIVRSLGYRARTAKDGAEGLVEVAKDPPDVVLLDLVMPVINGPELLRRIRPSHPLLPVVIVTGHPDSDLMTQSVEHGAVLMLTKPVEPILLSNALQMVLGPRSQRTPPVHRSALSSEPEQGRVHHE